MTRRMPRRSPTALPARHGFFTRRAASPRGRIASLNCSLSGQRPARGGAGEPRPRRRARSAPTRRAWSGSRRCTAPTVVRVTEPWPAGAGPRADAMVTDRPGIALGIVTADCAPVLFADPDGRRGRRRPCRLARRGRRRAGGDGRRDGRARRRAGADRRRDRAVHRPGLLRGRPPTCATPCWRATRDARFFARRRGRGAGSSTSPATAPPGWRRRASRAIERVAADTAADAARFFSHRRRTLAGGGPIGHQISVVACGEVLALSRLALAACCSPAAAICRGRSRATPARSARMLAQPPPARLAVPDPTDALLPDDAGHRFADAVADGAGGARGAGGRRAGAARRLARSTVARGPARRQRGAELHRHRPDRQDTGQHRGRRRSRPPPGPPARRTCCKQAAAARRPRASPTLLTSIDAMLRRSDPNSLVNRPPRVLVAAVTGAPGDGNRALALADAPAAAATRASGAGHAAGRRLHRHRRGAAPSPVAGRHDAGGDPVERHRRAGPRPRQGGAAQRRAAAARWTATGATSRWWWRRRRRAA